MRTTKSHNYDTSTYPEAIKEIEQTILDTEASIAGLERDWQPLDLGLPDSLGYVAGPTFYAFLLRDGRAYQFMASRSDGDPPHEVRKAAFFDLLKNFRTRALYEVPSEPGICIPYGFIADQGELYSHTEVSLRYKDRPGVIYSLGSRVVNELGYFGESPMLTATARSTGVVGGAASLGATARAIGPRPVKIGALDGWQGGAVVNLAEAGKPPIWNYSVYSAYEGYPHSRLLPSIRVELRSFLKTPEKPPPVKPAPPDYRVNNLMLECKLDRRTMAFDMALVNGHALSHTPWTITSGGGQPEGLGLIADEHVIASGTTDEKGKLVLSASQKKALAKAYAANLDDVWVAYPGASGLLGVACGDWKKLEKLARAKGPAKASDETPGQPDTEEARQAQEETLKENPPPIEESLQRLDTLLQSIRLRPTTPAMPGMPEAM